MLCLGPKKSFCHQGLNSWPRAWHSIPMIRAKCDTTQLFRRPNYRPDLIIILLMLLHFIYLFATIYHLGQYTKPSTHSTKEPHDWFHSRKTWGLQVLGGPSIYSHELYQYRYCRNATLCLLLFEAIITQWTRHKLWMNRPPWTNYSLGIKSTEM